MPNCWNLKVHFNCCEIVFFWVLFLHAKHAQVALTYHVRNKPKVSFIIGPNIKVFNWPTTSKWFHKLIRLSMKVILKVILSLNFEPFKFYCQFSVSSLIINCTYSE
jgi:hypothetical protein